MRFLTNCLLVMTVCLPVLASAEPLSNVDFDQVLALPGRAPDATISYGSAEQQFSQLWLPSGAPPPNGHPIVVLVHGGCWLNAFGVEHLGGAGTALAALGVAVWAPEYRRVGDPGGGWPGSLLDVQASLASLSVYDQDKLDKHSVVIAGHSAGGHLALLAMASVPAGLTVRGVVGLAAITDLEAYARGDNSCERAASAFMGGDVDALQAAYASANPIRQSTHPGTTLMTGTMDSIVTPPQGEMVDAVQVVVQAAGHFDFIHPQTIAWQRFTRLIEEQLQ